MIIWDGITLPTTLKPEANALRQKLANAARDFDWEKMLAILQAKPELVNVTRPGGKSLFTPLHQAAFGGAPKEVVQELIDLGAWRTICTAQGERAVDIAHQQGHLPLVSLLEPILLRHVDLKVLTLIQDYFHAVIRGRARDLVEKHQLRLPELMPLLEMDKVKVWFAVPGMYGGFSFWLEEDSDQVCLMTESWCRVAGGSGQRHAITAQGIQLVEEGFV